MQQPGRRSKCKTEHFFLVIAVTLYKIAHRISHRVHCHQMLEMPKAWLQKQKDTSLRFLSQEAPDPLSSEVQRILCMKEQSVLALISYALNTIC